MTAEDIPDVADSIAASASPQPSTTQPEATSSTSPSTAALKPDPNGTPIVISDNTLKDSPLDAGIPAHETVKVGKTVTVTLPAPIEKKGGLSVLSDDKAVADMDAAASNPYAGKIAIKGLSEGRVRVGVAPTDAQGKVTDDYVVYEIEVIK